MRGAQLFSLRNVMWLEYSRASSRPLGLVTRHVIITPRLPARFIRDAGRGRDTYCNWVIVTE